MTHFAWEDVGAVTPEEIARDMIRDGKRDPVAEAEHIAASLSALGDEWDVTYDTDAMARDIQAALSGMGD